MGKAGAAVTFATPRELHQLRLIEIATKRKILRHLNEALEEQKRLTVEKLSQIVEQKDTHNYQELAQSLLEEHDSMTLLAAALKILTKEPDTTPVKLTEETTQMRKNTGGFKSGAPEPYWSRREHKGGLGDSRKKKPCGKGFR